MREAADRLAPEIGLSLAAEMRDLILHHYEMSPYAEKIRLALGRKGLAWRSVQTPMVMPKPDHVELTDLERTGMILPTKLLQIRANLDRLEQMLADGRRFLLGVEPTLADLSAFHPLAALGLHDRTAALLKPLRRVPAWM